MKRFLSLALALLLCVSALSTMVFAAPTPAAITITLTGTSAAPSVAVDNATVNFGTFVADSATVVPSPATEAVTVTIDNQTGGAVTFAPGALTKYSSTIPVSIPNGASTASIAPNYVAGDTATTYNETFLLTFGTSPTTTTTNLTLQSTLADATYGLSTSGSAISKSVVTGQTIPAAIGSFAVTNTGNFAQTGLTATVSGAPAGTTFTAAIVIPAPGILAAGDSIPVNITATGAPTTAGNYTVNVKVTSNENSTGDTFSVAVTVGAATYGPLTNSGNLTATAVQNTAPTIATGTNPVTISHLTGNSNITDLTYSITGTGAAYFDVTLSNTTLNAGGSVTATVAPSVTNPPNVGTYYADVKVYSPTKNTTGTTFRVTLTVTATPTYTLTMTPTSATFTNTTTTQTFTVRNGGNTQQTGLTYTLTGANAADFDIVNTPATTLNPNATTTVQVRPKATNTPGTTYTASLDVKSTQNATGVSSTLTCLIPVQNGLTVTPSSAVYQVSDSDALAYSGTFTVKNTGNVTQTLSAPVVSGTGAAHFDGGTYNTMTLAPGATATLTITSVGANPGIDGAYPASFKLNSDKNTNGTNTT